mmetsp:Transcript_20289/g.31341  ORF Transcript_20289/g.31341 Transcript_20289/m.31341 type:complete len:88 (-) Transcript_20289:252-515(-)
MITLEDAHLPHRHRPFGEPSDDGLESEEELVEVKRLPLQHAAAAGGGGGLFAPGPAGLRSADAAVRPPLPDGGASTACYGWSSLCCS